MAISITIPPLGDTTDEVRLVHWFKQEGDPVHKGEPLFAIETDKAVLEVEALAEGVLAEIAVGDDTAAQVGDVVGWIEAVQ
jgi:pyruvate dehydrogenase E2 component (dihydrolipoamide acetyltransferase)